jgi:putative ABC transport system permease protein
MGKAGRSHCPHSAPCERGRPALSHPLDNLGDDIRDHIERETRDNMDRGMSPGEARAAALRRFGNVTRAMENTRIVWRPVWVEQLVQDVRQGIRMLRRNPGFAAVVVLTLALGIGINTAVFGLVNAILVRPLPYPNPDRLVWLGNYNRFFRAEMVSSPDYLDWKDQSASFQAMVAYGYRGHTVTTAEGAEQHRIADVTADFWALSGARPALGRFFGPEDRDGIVLSDELFERQFHRDPHVVGGSVTMDGRSVTVLGVLPKGFRFLFPMGLFLQTDSGRDIEGYIPNSVAWQHPSRDGNFSTVRVVAKLKPGVSIGRAWSELAGIQARIAKGNPNFDAQSLQVTPLQEKLAAGARPALLVLLAAVSFVLLIACANIANLLLARGAARQKEIAIRTAIGAGRARVIRQFLGENLALALLGGTLGLLLARVAMPVIVRLASPSLPRLDETTIDGRVLLFALAATLVTGFIFGITPALLLRRSKPYEVLKQGGRTSAAGSAGLPLQSLLVTAELALALVLLTGAGLMLKSFWRMNARPPGFVPERILALQVPLSGPQYRAVAEQRRFAEEILERVRRVPGVQAAGVLAQAMLRGSGTAPHDPNVTSLSSAQVMHLPHVTFCTVSSGFARVLGLRVVRGRWLMEHEAAPAVVVNESLAHEFFGAGNAVGKQLGLGPNVDDPSTAASIVGVVSDLQYSRRDAAAEPEMYIPYQLSSSLLGMTIMVRTTAGAGALEPPIRNLIASIDRTQPVYEVKTLEQALADSIAPRRFNLYLLGAFAASALLLALIGIYGVIAYAVAQRTHEIGVRLALGAQRSQVVRLVVREGMRLAALGITVGLAAAFGLTRLMTSLLYDVTPTDPSTYAMVAGALAATALAACWKPALQAAWVDPATALREE